MQYQLNAVVLSVSDLVTPSCSRLFSCLFKLFLACFNLQAVEFLLRSLTRTLGPEDKLVGHISTRLAGDDTVHLDAAS